MKFQKSLIAILGIFVLFFTLSFSLVSALTLSTPSKLTKGLNQTSILLTNNNNVTQNVSLTVSNIVSGSNQVVFTLTPNQVNNFIAGDTKTINIVASNFIGDLNFGRYSSTITTRGFNSASGDSVSNVSTTLSFEKGFCKSGEVSTSSDDIDLKIRSVDIESDGDDDDEWKLTDIITVQVEVENNGNDDADDVFVELGLFDSSGDNMVGDLDFENTDEEEIDVGTIGDDDSEEVEFKFRVPADLDEGSYKLTVKVYSDDVGESKECADTSSDLDNDFFEDVSIESENDEGKFIAIEDIELNPSEATCGDEVTLTANVFNIGDEDQDQVKINLVSKDLDLNQAFEIRNDLDKGDDERISFTFKIPQGLQDKTYRLELSSEYDYRNGNYRESSDDDEVVPFRVLGCQAPTQPPTGTGGTPGTGRIASITASLDSDAKAGEELVVKGRITNLGTSEADFVISATGYESWGDLSSISDRIVTLGAGQSKEATFNFDVNKDSSGEETFTIEVRSGNKVETREIAVNIEKATSGGITGLTSLNLGNNALIWIVGAINLILIIIIIIVAVRISRR